MIFNHAFRCAALIALSLFLSACSLVPHQSTPQVDIAEHTQVSLPTPASLGYQLSASQLITASWAIDGKTTSEQLPVQLQVTNNEVVLAGFSSWGGQEYCHCLTMENKSKPKYSTVYKVRYRSQNRYYLT